MKTAVKLRQARVAAQRLLVANGYAVRDAAASSAELRQFRRDTALSVQDTRNCREGQAVNYDGFVRMEREQLLAKPNWLSEYYRYKVCPADRFLGLRVFTVLAHADNWELTLLHITQRAVSNQTLRPHRKNTEPDESDSAAAEHNAPAPDSE